MRARPIGAALAIIAMIIPTASFAAETVGTVASGTSVFVARDGTVIPAVAGMKLYSSDRVITRDGGSANVTMANNCGVTVGASAMLPMAGASCAKPNVIAFDEGRAGYAGRTSAFEGNNGWLIAGGSVAAILLLFFLLRGNHHHGNGTPTSP